MEIVLIDSITRHPEDVGTVAGWIFEEFVRQHGKHDLAYITERFGSRRDDRPPVTLLALSGNECVGTVSLFDNDLACRPDLTPWLGALFVPLRFRGRGIARLLIGELIGVSARLGYGTLYLRTEHASEYYRKRSWTFLEQTTDEYGQTTEVFFRKIS